MRINKNYADCKPDIEPDASIFPDASVRIYHREGGTSQSK
jgi:hypothetical protein